MAPLTRPSQKGFLKRSIRSACIPKENAVAVAVAVPRLGRPQPIGAGELTDHPNFLDMLHYTGSGPFGPCATYPPGASSSTEGTVRAVRRARLARGLPTSSVARSRSKLP